MAYLYAGLGVAMLTGIMAIFEMATSYVQFQNTWEPSKASQDLSKEYFGGSFASRDKSIIDEIKSGSAKNICEKASADGDPGSLFKDDDGNSSLSEYDFHETVSSFPYGCYYQLDSTSDPAKIGHRIIFDKNNGLWSCALASGQSKCNFEK